MLKKIVFAWLVCAGFPWAWSEMPAASEKSGRDIMQKQKDLHKSAYEYIEQSTVLVDKTGRKEVREVRYYVKEVAPDVYRMLIVFLSPADIRGTALLTWQHKDQEDDQWLYLPAQGKMQRIAKGGRRNYFMGTDFTYEDLERESLEDYLYSVLAEEELDGSLCYVIQAVPVDDQKKRESGYGKRILWIDKANYTTLKIEFYDRRMKLVKTQVSRDWENVGGTKWRPQKMLMDNHKEDHKTLSGVTKRQVDREIDDQVFTERFILTGRHTQ